MSEAHSPELDPLYDQAVGIVLQHRRASISLVQRHLRIGYNRTAQILKQMERNGLISLMRTNGNHDISAPVPHEGSVLAVGGPYDEKFIHELVDDSWRSFLTFAAQGSQALGVACIERLDERSQQIAKTLEATAGMRFLAGVEAERVRIFDEYTKDPDALKRRLGVHAPTVAADQQQRGRSSRSLGELAVRTAVRATVWESISAIFRVFR